MISNLRDESETRAKIIDTRQRLTGIDECARRVDIQVFHRPWPLPNGPWIMTQSWHDLLFAHWPVDARTVQERLGEQGTRRADSAELVRPLRDLLSDQAFWQTQSDGLAIFLAPGVLRTYLADFHGATASLGAARGADDEAELGSAISERERAMSLAHHARNHTRARIVSYELHALSEKHQSEITAIRRAIVQESCRNRPMTFALLCGFTGVLNCRTRSGAPPEYST